MGCCNKLYIFGIISVIHCWQWWQGKMCPKAPIYSQALPWPCSHNYACFIAAPHSNPEMQVLENTDFSHGPSLSGAGSSLVSVCSFSTSTTCAEMLPRGSVGAPSASQCEMKSDRGGSSKGQHLLTPDLQRHVHLDCPYGPARDCFTSAQEP